MNTATADARSATGQASPLVSTIGYVEQLARQGGALPVLIALAAALAKAAGGVLALAVVGYRRRTAMYLTGRGALYAGEETNAPVPTRRRGVGRSSHA